MNNQAWRIIWEDKPHNCYFNMGLDKAIMESVGKELVPNTLRLYQWQPSAVTIGYFQSMNNVINIQNCKEQNIDFTRRITGGGAVFHDSEGELTYSVNCLNNDKILPQDITEIYRKICGGIVLGLEELEINSEFKPINDIILTKNGKKISGSALTRRGGVVLQHGTILRKIDVEKMFSVLIVPDEKIKDKLISSAKERVSSLEIELGEIPSMKEIGAALISGLRKELDIELEFGSLLESEKINANKYAMDHFKNQEWLFKR